MLKLILAGVALLAVAAIVVIAVAYWRFNAEIDSDLARLVADARAPADTITPARLAGLPEPARRYFEAAGVVGQPIPRIVRLKQTGRIRSSASADWMAFDAEETYSTSPPAFIWRTWLPSRSLPVAMGRDVYQDGAGSIVIRMGALLPLADEQGDALRAAGLMRYLNEMAWFPAALLGDNVTIAADGEDSFRVTLADRDLTATALMFVDAEGRLINFRAERFNTSTASIETWETPMTAWHSFEGISVPSVGSAVWKLPGGDFTYIELEITDLAYD